MAVLNVSRKRPEKLENHAYVNAAIKYSIFNEMKKMRRREKHVYLSREEEESTQIIDVLPTKETCIEKIDKLDELLYKIKHEFSNKEAESLEALLENAIIFMT